MNINVIDMKQWEDERAPLNREKLKKGLSRELEKKLEKKYSPSSRVDLVFRGNDVTFYTNPMGEAETLFIGKRKENGDITGTQYYRRIKKQENGIIKESHWDNQGKVTRSRRQ